VSSADDDGLVVHIDFTYAEVYYELWSLRHLVDGIESGIQHIAERDRAITVEELAAHGWASDEAERSLAAQDAAEQAQRVLPRLMRGSLLVSMCACYESGVKTIISRLRELLGLRLDLRDLRSGRSVVAQAKRYLDVLVEIELDAQL
jgi:hypothetical protein